MKSILLTTANLILIIVSIANPQNVERAGSCVTPGEGWDVFVLEDIALSRIIHKNYFSPKLT